MMYKHTIQPHIGYRLESLLMLILSYLKINLSLIKIEWLIYAICWTISNILGGRYTNENTRYSKEKKNQFPDRNSEKREILFTF